MKLSPSLSLAGIALLLGAPSLHSAPLSHIPTSEHVGSSVAKRLEDPVLRKALAQSRALQEVINSIRGSSKTSPGDLNHEILAGFYYIASKNPFSPDKPSRKLPNTEQARLLEETLLTRLNRLAQGLKGIEPESKEFEEKAESLSEELFGSWDRTSFFFRQRAGTTGPSVPQVVPARKTRNLDSPVYPLPKELFSLETELDDIFPHAFAQSYNALQDLHRLRNTLSGAQAANSLLNADTHFAHLVEAVIPRALESIQAAKGKTWFFRPTQKIKKGLDLVRKYIDDLNRVILSPGHLERILSESNLSIDDEEVIRANHKRLTTDLNRLSTSLD